MLAQGPGLGPGLGLGLGLSFLGDAVILEESGFVGPGESDSVGLVVLVVLVGLAGQAGQGSMV